MDQNMGMGAYMDKPSERAQKKLYQTTKKGGGALTRRWALIRDNTVLYTQNEQKQNQWFVLLVTFSNGSNESKHLLSTRLSRTLQMGKRGEPRLHADQCCTVRDCTHILERHYCSEIIKCVCSNSGHLEDGIFWSL